MKATPPKPLTLDDVNFETRRNSYWVQDAIKLGKALEEDLDKKDRLARLNCKRCYYISTLAGQAFTEYACALCGKIDMHSNTNVPKLCLECAKSKKLCADCGCSLDGKQKDTL